jgi:excisionase family DNA binding protein
MNFQRPVLTPEQAADYLQVNRETVYRYIRDGRLVASRLGRSYRIPKVSLDQLLWQSRTRTDIALRTYSDDEVAGFLRDDVLTDEEQAIVARLVRDDRSA